MPYPTQGLDALGEYREANREREATCARRQYIAFGRGRDPSVRKDTLRYLEELTSNSKLVSLRKSKYCR